MIKYKYITTVSMSSSLDAPGAEDGQWSTLCSLGQPTAAMWCSIDLLTSISKEQTQLCIIYTSHFTAWAQSEQGEATHETSGPKGLSVVKAIAELPLIGDLSMVRRVRVGGYFRCDET